MKDKIKEYLQEKGRVTVNDLAQALGKDQIRFEDDGSLCLDQKKKHEITLKGVFHAHKNGFGFVSLEGEEDDLFVGKNDVNYAIDGDTVEVVIKKVADRNKGKLSIS